MWSSRKLRWSLTGVIVVVLLCLAWCAFRAWQVQRDLNRAVDAAEKVKAAVTAGDSDAIDRSIADLRSASSKAADATSGPTWSVLSHVPLFGDDARGVRLTSQVLSDLARDGATPLARVSDRLDDLLPRKKRIDLATVGQLRQPLQQAHAAFSAADRRLVGVDSSGFVSSLKDRFDQFRDDVHTADGAMSSATLTAKLLPGMLGQQGPRTFLLVFQNNAEVRAGGGLAGAVAEIRADHGKLSIVRQTTGGDVQRRSGATFPISKPERQQYGSVLGHYFVDANMTPDFPRAADLMREHWSAAYPGDKLDGVITIDTVALSYVLDQTGPITVDGVKLTGDTLVDELLHNTYVRLAGQHRRQDKFFADTAAAAFDKFTTGISNGSGVVKALARAASEGRVEVHSFDAAEQRQLAGTKVAGEFVTDPKVDSPQINVTVNDTTASKMSYYLRYNVDVTPTYCTAGVQGFTAKARLEGTAPKNAATLPDDITGAGLAGIAPGHELVTLRIYAPTDGALGKLTWNGKPMNLLRGVQDGRPWGMTYIDLAPGQVVDLAWTMKSGKGQTAGSDVRVTPSIAAGSGDATLATACD